MSISTLDLPQTRAERLADLLDASAARAREDFAQDVRAAFRLAFEGQMTMVEYVQRVPGCIRHQPTREAFYEELDYLGPQQALWAVLKDSTCPLVAQLRKAVEDSYIERWAQEVGEFRSEA